MSLRNDLTVASRPDHGIDHGLRQAFAWPTTIGEVLLDILQNPADDPKGSAGVIRSREDRVGAYGRGMTGQTRVVYTKYDNSLHWNHVMRRLGEDRHGVWLGAPPGTLLQKGVAGREHVTEHPHVMLFRPDVWWTAAFNGPPHETEIYCDITSPVRWLHQGQVTMVDLDLDVSRARADGRVVLWDEDEFDEHRLRWAYPPEVVDAARASAAWLLTALADGTEPFASEYRAWLELVS